MRFLPKDMGRQVSEKRKAEGRMLKTMCGKHFAARDCSLQVDNEGLLLGGMC